MRFKGRLHVARVLQGSFGGVNFNNTFDYTWVLINLDFMRSCKVFLHYLLHLGTIFMVASNVHLGRTKMMYFVCCVWKIS